MQFEYTLHEEDYVTHQLFVSSESKKNKRNRFLIRLAGPVIYSIAGLKNILDKHYVGFGLFILIALLWYFLYPLWQKRFYTRFYRKFIQEHFKERIGVVMQMDIQPNQITTKQAHAESTIDTVTIKEIIELPTLLLISIKGGLMYLLPKDRLSDLQSSVAFLKNLASQLQVPYRENLDWQWS